jgi:hypothetical protein
MKMVSAPLQKGDKRSVYHFEVYHIDYNKTLQEKISEKKHTEFDYKKGYIKIESQSAGNTTNKAAEYTDLRGNTQSKNTLIQYNTFIVDQVADNIMRFI